MWGRDHAKARQLASAAGDLGLEAEAVEDIEATARGVDVISCATFSPDPLVLGDWLRDGTHLDLVGGYRPEVRETDDTSIRRANVFCDTLTGAPKAAGDLTQPLASGVLNFDDLVVSTYGRGYYILDDLSALRQFNPALKESPQVFDPRKSYRLNNKESIKTDGYSFNSGRNPAYGTPINYYLPDTLTEKVLIEIRDEKNQIIRTLKGSNETGVNRVMWDLRYEPTYKPQLRTRPSGRPSCPSARRD